MTSRPKKPRSPKTKASDVTPAKPGMIRILIDPALIPTDLDSDDAIKRAAAAIYAAIRAEMAAANPSLPPTS